jgi:hypothetical protein
VVRGANFLFTRSPRRRQRAAKSGQLDRLRRRLEVDHQLFKGAGEAGATGAPPAVVGAILDALRPLGITHIDMPATPNKIWHALQSASAAEAAAE